jgi:hypothetical protein
MIQEPAISARVDVMLPPGGQIMRWKISPDGHDPRQIDLLAVAAIVVVILTAYVAIEHYASRPAGPTAFIVPSQSTRW